MSRLCQNDIFIAWRGLSYMYYYKTSLILDIKQAFSGYKQGTTLGFTKGVNPGVWSKKLKLVLCFVGQNRPIYNVW